ncbi:MAG TPA: DUF3084 domain-containing protein [bacterium]|nr:DUF3084 domain-containing protein [bacterium]
MDLRGIALVVLLVFISGLIAYIGDYVGRKVGKKRISLFNLRPKYTSIIVTIITGAVIVSVTLILLFAFSQYARTSFFGLKRIVDELETRKVQLQESTALFEKKQKELERSTFEYKRQEEELRAEIERNREDYKENVERLDEILGNINIKSIELNELQESHDMMSVDFAKLKKETAELTERKNELEGEIKISIDRISQLSVETLYGDIVYHRDQLLARVVISKSIKESDLKTQLMAMINSLLAEAVERGVIVDKDTGLIFNEQFKGLMDVMKASKDDVIIDALAANNVFKGQQMYIKMRPTVNRRIFSTGEIIVEQRVSGEMTRIEAEQFVSSALQRVSAEALKRGMLPDAETKRIGAVPAKDYLDIIERLMRNRDNDALLRAVAAKDVRASDRLDIAFTLY